MWWDNELKPLGDAYPHAILHPRENSYGIHLFSRFALIDPLVLPMRAPASSPCGAAPMRLDRL